MSENKNKLGQEPAFQVPTNCSLKLDSNGKVINSPEDGMSKRFYAACQIAPALISESLTDKDLRESIDKLMKKYNLSAPEVTINIIYEYVDELLKQE